MNFDDVVDGVRELRKALARAEDRAAGALAVLHSVAARLGDMPRSEARDVVLADVVNAIGDAGADFGELAVLRKLREATDRATEYRERLEGWTTCAGCGADATPGYVIKHKKNCSKALERELDSLRGRIRTSARAGITAPCEKCGARLWLELPECAGFECGGCEHRESYRLVMEHHDKMRRMREGAE